MLTFVETLGWAVGEMAVAFRRSRRFVYSLPLPPEKECSVFGEIDDRDRLGKDFVNSSISDGNAQNHQNRKI